MNGSLYRIRDVRTGELEGLEGVFAVGNAVTGRGNILVSQKHGWLVSQQMLEHYLLGTASGYEDVLAAATDAARAKVEAVSDRLAGRTPLPEQTVAEVLARVTAMQRRVEYPGDYREWIAQVRPVMV